MNLSYPPFVGPGNGTDKYVPWTTLPIRYRQTVVTLKIHNSSLDRLGKAYILTLHHPCLGFDRYWAKLTNPLLCKVAAISSLFLDFTAESRGENRLRLRFHKHTTVITLCVDCVDQIYVSLFRAALFNRCARSTLGCTKYAWGVPLQGVHTGVSQTCHTKQIISSIS